MPQDNKKMRVILQLLPVLYIPPFIYYTSKNWSKTDQILNELQRI